FEYQILSAIFSFEIRVQNDILKRLYHTEDTPQGRNRGDAEVTVAAPLAAFLHTPLDVQELKANKEELRIEKLKDKEEVEDLTQEMAELRSSCGRRKHSVKAEEEGAVLLLQLQVFLQKGNESAKVEEEGEAVGSWLVTLQ
ncbi:hypothetical protein S83_042584, partial [Arachis hypogaea]